jgi:hypothetical protein
MLWAWGATDPQPIRTGVEYIPATITIVPGPGVGLVGGTAALLFARRQRNKS